MKVIIFGAKGYIGKKLFRFLHEKGVEVEVKRFIYASTGNAYRPSFKAMPETAPIGKDNGYVMTKI